jgi:hypothetical protein
MENIILLHQLFCVGVFKGNDMEGRVLGVFCVGFL